MIKYLVFIIGIFITSHSYATTTTAFLRSKVTNETPGFFIRNAYGSVNVTTAAYVQLVASTTLPTSSMEIFDSSGQTLKIAFGSAGNEVDQFQITPGGNERIPVLIPVGTRVSIKAISANATTGELDINFYN
jgi:hypothetical protein